MNRERASMIAVLSAMALVVLDAGLVNVALPVIASSLKASPGDAVLIVSAYQAALVMGLLPCAHLAERFGSRRLFTLGLMLFSGASLLCAIAPTLPLLVAARFVQGLGGAAIMALGVALLRFALGPERLGAVIGWNALTVALCSAAGPILGAIMLSLAPWPWLFLIKAPIIVVALNASRGLPDVASSRSSVDGVGIALHAGVTVLTLATVEIASAQPLAAAVIASVAIVAAAMLIRRERSKGGSVWPIDLLTLRPLRVAVTASVFCFTGQTAGLLALSFHLQLSLGYGSLSAGIVMTCWPLAVALTSIVANRLAGRLGSALLCVCGAGLLAAGLFLSALSGALAPLVIGVTLSGIGFGLFQVPNNRTLFLSASPERSAAAGGLQGSARLIGQTLGALMIGFIFAALPAVIAPRSGFAVASLFATAAALVSALEISALRRRAGARTPITPFGKGEMS